MKPLSINQKSLKKVNSFSHLGYIVEVCSFDAGNEIVQAPAELFCFSLNSIPHLHRVFTTEEDASNAARKLIDFIMDDGA